MPNENQTIVEDTLSKLSSVIGQFHGDLMEILASKQDDKLKIMRIEALEYALIASIEMLYYPNVLA